MPAAGYKLFVTGDVLTAAQVNDYLMLQTVMVFADSAARTSALSAVLAEGLVSYLQDTNVVEIYTGAAWVSLDDPNAIQNSIVDAKGDLISATADNTPARLAVGTANQVLTVDSSTATGLKWATPSAGGAYTVIQSGTLSTTSVPLNSIPQTYKHLQLVMWGTTFSANDGFALQINGITASNYARSSYGQNGGTSVDGSTIVDNGVYYGNGAADPLFSSSFNHWVLDIYDYTNTVGAWAMRGNGTYLNTSSVYSTYQAAYTYVGATATAITSINIKTGGSRTMAGNYIFYGVN